MPQGTMEHVNLAVSDIDRLSVLLQSLLGWQVRWRGPAMNGGETIHVGTTDAYLALYTNPQVKARGPVRLGVPLNHIGLQVDDLDSAQQVVEANGLATYHHSDYAPGKRFYFLDWDGIEFEVVSYA
jgi:glyoxylase I family protein